MKNIKKLILVLVALTPSAYADDSSSGCGVGWMVVKQNTLVSSFVRQLTNVTFSNTIAMTSGTSGCAKHQIVKNENLPQHFAEANFHQLMVEMAQGDGAYLQAFAWTLGCQSEASYQSFRSNVQQQYEGIFPAQNANPTSMLKAVRGVMGSHPALARSCGA